MERIIERKKSIIPACDIPLDDFKEIVEGTGNVDGVGGYKIGLFLALKYGLPKIVEVAREHTDKPIIYDHQKAGNDIPPLGEKFATVCKESGVDAVIIFPQGGGPITQYEWTIAAQERGLGVIVGGKMTQPRYSQGDFSNTKDKNYTEIFRGLGMKKDLDGYVKEFGPEDIYELAARMGVTNFVMPGNQPELIEHYKSLVESCGVVDPAIFSPGFIVQGGEITKGAKAAGRRFHAIVGGGIYNAKDKKQAALDLTSQI